MESSGGVRSLANRSLRPKSVDMSNKDTGIHNIGITHDLRRALCRLGLAPIGTWQDGGVADWVLFNQLKILRNIGVPIEVEECMGRFRFRQNPK